MATDEIWNKRVQRESISRKEAERLLEEKSQVLWRANCELQKLTNNLEIKVAERTLALSDALLDAEIRKYQLVESNRQLEIAKQYAEESSQMKSNFLANISHEIRTPLNSIISYTHLLHKKIETSEETEWLDKIQAASQHLLKIINNIIDAAKIESKSLDLRPAPFVFAHLLENLIKSEVAEAERKGIDFYLDLSEKLPNLFIGDINRLHQLLAIFLSNAIKFTLKGRITLSISLQEQSEQDVLLLFRIQDTGIGIKEEQIANIFENFFQGESGSTRRFEGNGIGLSLAKKLTKLMGGTIEVSSQEGVGSNFSFTVQLHCLPLLDLRDLPREKTNDTEHNFPVPKINGFDNEVALSNMLQSNLLYHRSLFELKRLSEQTWQLLSSIDQPSFTLATETKTRLLDLLQEIYHRATVLAAVNISTNCINWLADLVENKLPDRQEWDIVWLDLHNYFSSPPTRAVDSKQSSPIDEIDQIELIKLKKQLLNLLAEGDTSAIEFVEKNSKVFAILLNDQYSDFNEYIRAFEFDLATELLSKLPNAST